MKKRKLNPYIKYDDNRHLKILMQHNDLSIKLKLRGSNGMPLLLKEILKNFDEGFHQTITNIFDIVWVTSKTMAENKNNPFIATIYDNGDTSNTQEDVGLQDSQT